MSHFNRFIVLVIVFILALPVLAQDGDVPALPATVDLPGEATFPEGILVAENGDLYVTGFGNGSIYRVVDGVEVEEFKASGEDGLSSAVGLQIDEERNRLWVANFAFEGFTSDIKVYDTETGELIASIAEEDDAPHFFNEVAIDDTGRVYISDTMAPVIWTVDADLSSAEIFVQDDLLANPERPFGLNGLALTPDGKYLIASVMDRLTQGGGRLVRIDVETREVSDVELSGEGNVIAQFGGSDGMYFYDGQLFMVNVTPPVAIITATFSDDYSSAELIARPAYDGVYDRPTSTAIRDGRLWVVNSQLDHIIDDANGAQGTAPRLPYQIVNVDLATLLGE